MRLRSWRGAGVVLGVLVVALAVWVVAPGRAGAPAAVAPTTSPAVSAAPRVGAPAPDFQLTDVNTGQAIRLAALRGRPVWINFWATWCKECKTELPTMKQLYEQYKSRGLAIVGVDMREDPAQVQTFTQSQGYDWLIGIDEDVQVRNRYNTVGIPNHVFVDAQGIVRAISLGHLDAPAMERALATIMNQ